MWQLVRRFFKATTDGLLYTPIVELLFWTLSGYIKPMFFRIIGRKN